MLHWTAFETNGWEPAARTPDMFTSCRSER